MNNLNLEELGLKVSEDIDLQELTEKLIKHINKDC
jgi:hypothetical protein